MRFVNLWCSKLSTSIEIISLTIILSTKEPVMVTCFLIDDDPDDLVIFTTALQDLGENHTCRYVSSGKEALELLEFEHFFTPDFIFIDVNMPYFTGLECLQCINSIARLSKTPIIMCSTSSEQRDISEAKYLGASHYLVKPASISLLSETLAKLFLDETLPFVIP